MAEIDLRKILTEKEVTAIRTLISRTGEREAADMLQVSRNSLQRLLAQLPSQRGTVALVRLRLTALGSTRWTNGGERTTPI
jgi:predicted DNA-binding protein (UPF0251 family)